MSGPAARSAIFVALAAMLAGADAARPQAGAQQAPTRDLPPSRPLPAPGQPPETSCDHLELYLPFPRGGSHSVLRGQRGPGGHDGAEAFAWDFAMPVGSAVVAAAAGIVVEIEDRHTRGGPDPELRQQANLIVVDHGRNCFSVYEHLAAGSVAVGEGERVARGTVLGAVGLTGYTREPHLHFAVVDERHRSTRVRFADVPGGEPSTGTRQVSANEPGPMIATKPSVLPAGVFAANRIRIESVVPSRRFAVPLTIRGRTIPGATAVAFLLPRAGGAPRAHASARADAGGRFAIDFDPGVVTGKFGFALALGGADGSYHSDFALPVVITRTE